MKINRFVIHELQKEASEASKLVLSEMLPEVTDQATNLLTQLNDKYKTRTTYGKFSDDTTHPFPQHFEKYCKVRHTDKTFLAFTSNAMNTLHNQLRNSNAKGGYFMFADYTNVHGNFVSIFLVRDSDGFLFKKDDKPMYDVKSQLHIGIEKLAMACKINKDNYLAGIEDKNYLSFIRTNRQETSNYFITWIAATALRKNTEYTDRLVEIIKMIELPTELFGYPEVNRDNLQKAVFNHCNSVPNGLVNLEELSQKLFGDDNGNKLIDYAAEQGMIIDTEFTPDKNKLKKLYRVKVSSHDISLQFDQSSFNNTIRIDPKQQNIITIESEELAKKILAEMGG